MKFVIATYGTEGDARPFAALCRGLMDAGHQTRLLADEATLGSARLLGVPTTALTGDIRSTLRGDHAGSGLVAKGGGFSDTARALAKIANDNAEPWLRTIIDAGAGCDALLAAGLAAFAALSAGEYLGVKVIGAGMIPITPTVAFASPFLPPKYVPRLLNRASHNFVNFMLWKAFRQKVNAAREIFNLPPREKLWTGHPMLYGISPCLLPAPTDWPPNAHLCGQWLAQQPWAPPAEVASFLAGGEAPVYIGFGSMTGFDGTRMVDALVQSMIGRRVLFSGGWSGIDAKALPDNFLSIGDMPHDWILPRTAVAIHHGGSGTSHSVARAGVPSIVVPFAGDQFFWAERLRVAGVAPPAVDGLRPKAEAFSRALEFAASSPVRNRARILGETMRAEDGVAQAVRQLTSNR